MYTELIINFIRNFSDKNGISPTADDITAFLGVSRDYALRLMQKMRANGIGLTKTHHDGKWFFSIPDDYDFSTISTTAKKYSSFFADAKCPSPRTAYAISSYLSTYGNSHHGGFSNQELSAALGISVYLIQHTTAWLASHHYISHEPHRIKDIQLIRMYVLPQGSANLKRSAPYQISPFKYSDKFKTLCCPNKFYATLITKIIDESGSPFVIKTMKQFAFEIDASYPVMQKTIGWLSANGYIDHKPRTSEYILIKRYYPQGKMQDLSNNRRCLAPKLAAQISAFIFDFNNTFNFSPSIATIKNAFDNSEYIISNAICWLARNGYISHTPYKHDDIVFISLYEYSPKRKSRDYLDQYESKLETQKKIKELSAMDYPKYIKTFSPNYY